jgi:hypothetical protein
VSRDWLGEMTTMAYAAYVEQSGYMKIGLYATERGAKKATCDQTKIVEVNAAGHTSTPEKLLPVYFTERDISYRELRAALESV